MSKKNYRSVKGMSDLFYPDSKKWLDVEDLARSTCGLYGYGEIRTPILESLELFARGVGEGTDIVEKEMYVLPDRDGSDLAMRPEGTASAVRALLQAGKLNKDCEEKAFYIGPMFRRERPQKGRLRQFHQLGVECMGIADPSADVEVIALAHQFLSRSGLNDLTLAINTLGRNADREKYSKALKEYLEDFESDLCDDCQRRLEKNPLRILDCKNLNCQDLLMKAPRTVDHLSKDAEDHYQAVKVGLDQAGIAYEETPGLVRGLDYYTDTVFEFMAATGLGAQNTVAAGGRYDNLVEELGGPAVPAVGFALGLERLIILMDAASASNFPNGPDLVLVGADEDGKKLASTICHQLRQKDVFADTDLKGRSVRAQFKRADRLKASHVLVIGQDELATSIAKLRKLADGSEVEVKLDTGAIAAAL